MKDRFRLPNQSHGRMWALYVAPFRAMIGGWMWKVPIGVVVAGLFQWLGGVGERYVEILQLPPLLIQIVVTLWAVDLVTGIYCVIRDEGVESISSIGIRQTIIKFSDYCIALFSATIFSGTGDFLGPLSHVFTQIPIVVATVIAATELRSIDENLDFNFVGRVRDSLNLGGFLAPQEDEPQDES